MRDHSGTVMKYLYEKICKCTLVMNSIEQIVRLLPLVTWMEQTSSSIYRDEFREDHLEVRGRNKIAYDK